jgi:hypothetical protein
VYATLVSAMVMVLLSKGTFRTRRYAGARTRRR